jgi:hypothetical protein
MGVRAAAGAPLVPGDRVAVGLAASWERYWSKATRTFDVGDDGLARAWTAETDTRFDGVTSRARPGAPRCLSNDRRHVGRHRYRVTLEALR